MRLNRFIALCGAASRRGADALIAAGKVQINGERALSPAVDVDAKKDSVTVEGRTLRPPEEKVYIMLNKPAGVLSSCGDDRGRPTVTDIVKYGSARLFPVGRLDMDTEGLLLLTNDGDFAFRLTHPKHETPKKYLAVVSGCPGEKSLGLLREGIEVDGRKTAGASIEVLSYGGGKIKLHVTIREGRNRQIKKMFEAVGHRVIYLKRIAIGGLGLGNLKTGHWRLLGPRDFEALREK